MKRLIAILALAMLALSGCASEETMYIEPAQLSKEEAKIAALMDANAAPSIFDFRAPQAARSMRVQVYRLEDGLWRETSGGGTFALSATKGRIFLDFGKLSEGLGISVQTGDDRSSNAHSIPADDALAGMARATGWLSERASLTLEEALPLILQVFDGGYAIGDCDPALFGSPERLEDYDAAFAVTVSFSAEALD